YNFLYYLSLSDHYSYFSLSDVEHIFTNQICSHLKQENDLNICNNHSLCISTDIALKELDKRMLRDNTVNATKWCQYLSYWIYDNIVKSNNCDKNELYIIIEVLRSYYLTISNNCYITNFKLIRKNLLTRKNYINLVKYCI
ncbi:hypothetical protein PCYB_002360, partial [Plasmodium cynomolgi strain B]